WLEGTHLCLLGSRGPSIGRSKLGSRQAVSLGHHKLEVTVRPLRNRRIAAGSLCFGLCFVTSMSANAGALPERVEKAAQERVAAGTYQTLVFGVVDGDQSEVVVFGRLDNGKAPDRDTVYEIGSITKTVTATLLAKAALSGRVTLDTAVAQL